MVSGACAGTSPRVSALRAREPTGCAARIGSGGGYMQSACHTERTSLTHCGEWSLAHFLPFWAQARLSTGRDFAARGYGALARECGVAERMWIVPERASGVEKRARGLSERRSGVSERAPGQEERARGLSARAPGPGNAAHGAPERARGGLARGSSGPIAARVAGERAPGAGNRGSGRRASAYGCAVSNPIGSERGYGGGNGGTGRR